jgi:hypothetical protein
MVGLIQSINQIKKKSSKPKKKKETNLLLRIPTIGGEDQPHDRQYIYEWDDPGTAAEPPTCPVLLSVHRSLLHLASPVYRCIQSPHSSTLPAPTPPTSSPRAHSIHRDRRGWGWRVMRR